MQGSLCPRRPVALVMWEALARNKQYAKDHAFSVRWENKFFLPDNKLSMVSILEYLNEDVSVPPEITDEILMLQQKVEKAKKRTKAVLAQEKKLEQLMEPIREQIVKARADKKKMAEIDERKKSACLPFMVDPRKIPDMIQQFRSLAEKSIPPGDKAKREQKIQEKLEQMLRAWIPTKVTNAVKQLSYTKTKDKNGIVDTETYVREKKFCRIEIDITGGTKEELLAEVEKIINNGRECIGLRQAPQRGKLQIELPVGKATEITTIWKIFDALKKREITSHRLAKEKLGTPENSGYNQQVHQLSKMISRANNKAKKLIYATYPSAS